MGSFLLYVDIIGDRIVKMEVGGRNSLQVGIERRGGGWENFSTRGVVLNAFA